MLTALTPTPVPDVARERGALLSIVFGRAQRMGAPAGHLSVGEGKVRARPGRRRYETVPGVMRIGSIDSPAALR